MLRLLALSLALISAPLAFALSDAELNSIGRRVWKNECGGTKEGLTSWNTGENFASLGIGHFIWYPRGVNGPFEESFPKLVRFLRARGASVPAWLTPDLDCPWKTRAEFQAASRGEQMTELREMLARTVHLQSQFLAERLEEALPKMRSAASGAAKENVARQFARMQGSGAGMYAMIDYVNFKGEGTKETERYKGQGWGLLQVLENMEGTGGGATKEFARSASEVLARRVQNAPAERKEGRWLAGWQNRVRAYGE